MNESDQPQGELLPAEPPWESEPVPATSGWPNIKAQLQRNSVAFVSLFIAVTGLLYNTWRNETSEYQRNIREAGFIAIEHLAEFQAQVNDVVYSDGCAMDHDIAAWSHIKALETLGEVLPQSAQQELGELGLRWAGHASELCEETTTDARRQKIDQEIIFPQVEKANMAIVGLVRNLR